MTKFYRYIIASFLLGSAVLSLLFIPTTFATQTSFQLKIEPLTCVIDVTALGSIAYSSIAPKECEHEYLKSPESLLTPNESTNQAVSTLLQTPVNGSVQNNNVLSLTYSQPVAEGSTIANVTSSTNTDLGAPSKVAVAVTAASIGTATAILIDSVFFGFRSVNAVRSSVINGFRSVKSGLGKSSK